MQGEELWLLVPMLIDPVVCWQAAIQKGVEVIRADGSPLSPHDLRRLEVSLPQYTPRIPACCACLFPSSLCAKPSVCSMKISPCMTAPEHLRFGAAQKYANNTVDHHLTMDLLPSLARAYFAQRLPATMSHGQAAILAVLGLQQRDVTTIERELNLPSSQVLALFNKVSTGSIKRTPEASDVGLSLLPPEQLSLGSLPAPLFTHLHVSLVTHRHLERPVFQHQYFTW